MRHNSVVNEIVASETSPVGVSLPPSSACFWNFFSSKPLPLYLYLAIRSLTIIYQQYHVTEVLAYVNSFWLYTLLKSESKDLWL